MLNGFFFEKGVYKYFFRYINWITIYRVFPPSWFSKLFNDYHGPLGRWDLLAHPVTQVIGKQALVDILNLSEVAWTCWGTVSYTHLTLPTIYSV